MGLPVFRDARYATVLEYAETIKKDPKSSSVLSTFIDHASGILDADRGDITHLVGQNLPFEELPLAVLAAYPAGLMAEGAVRIAYATMLQYDAEQRGSCLLADDAHRQSIDHFVRLTPSGS